MKPISNGTLACCTILNETLPFGVHLIIWPKPPPLCWISDSGLLSMMAARAGAAQVIAVEANHTIAACAKQVIHDNNLSHVIRVEPVHSSQLRETKATLLVAEIVDSFLLGEGILPTFLHAKQYLLQETAEVIPCGAVVTACLIESPFLASLLPTSLNKRVLIHYISSEN
jgi:predicted RNA methylase